MTITIAHLYNDFLNLYGEIGNIKALKHNLQTKNLTVKVKNIGLNDPINLENIDILYLGSGTEKNRTIALEHLLKYQKDLKEFINNPKKLLIATGSSYALFGKTIIDESQKPIPALNIFPYEEIVTNRIVKETTSQSTISKDLVYAFENHDNGIINNTPWLEEGHHEKSFYGTYKIGPLLIRNPDLLNNILKKYLKNKNIKYQKKDQSLEHLAYLEFINYKKTKIKIK